MSVREVAAAVGVSRGTASLWLRDVPLAPDQRAALAARNPIYSSQTTGADAKAAIARVRRARWQQEGRVRARERDPDYVAGCMLYWAEGTKDRNQLRLTNSDPSMIGFFARFLRRQFAVPDDRFRVWCNLFADHQDRQAAVENFWLAVVGVSRACLRKSAVNVYSRYTKRKRTNLLLYGTCQLIVCSTEVVQTIYGSIQELGGFDRPEWLG